MIVESVVIGNRSLIDRVSRINGSSHKGYVENVIFCATAICTAIYNRKGFIIILESTPFLICNLFFLFEKLFSAIGGLTDEFGVSKVGVKGKLVEGVNIVCEDFNIGININILFWE